MAGTPGRLAKTLGLAVDLRSGEARPLALAFGYFFCLFACLYLLRPVRDELGIQGGVENLPWMFTATFLTMLAAVPLFAAVVSRWPRRRSVPVVYRFFLVNLLVFWALLRWEVGGGHPARAFFVWMSVFNLFVVSVSWSVMADLFTAEQGKRLFGCVAAGATTGGLAGPLLAATLARPLGPVELLLVAAVVLEAATWCAAGLGRASVGAGRPAADTALGGRLFAGITHVLRDRYLAGICVYMLLYTATSTVLYIEQQHLVGQAVEDSATRTALFASIDLAVNTLTLVLQGLVTGRLMAGLGVGPLLAVVPALTAAGFAALAAVPTVAMVAVFQGVRRAANYALARPAREVLFTVLGREDKYKAKSFIDTVVYRGGDALSGWAFVGLEAVGMSLPLIAGAAVPVSALWLAVGLWLGRREERLAGSAAAEAGTIVPLEMST